MKHLLLITLIVCGSACQTTVEDVNLDRIAQESKAMLVAFHDSINQTDLMAEFAFLDSTSAFYWIPPGYNYAIGYDSIRNILIESNRQLQSVYFDWDTLDVFPLSKDYCNFRGVVHCEMTGQDSVKQIFNVIESGTLVKRDDGWKMLSGQSRVQ